MTRPLKVGVQLPEVEREVRWPELRDMARAAEQAGVGSLWGGGHPLVHGAFGSPFDHRVGRLEEAFAIIRGLLRDGEVDFAGRYHQARECVLLPPPARKGGPPIMVGTTGPRMLRLG